MPDNAANLSTPYTYDRDTGPATPNAYDVTYTFTPSCIALCIDSNSDNAVWKATLPSPPSTNKLAQGVFPYFANLSDPDNGALGMQWFLCNL